MSRVPADLQQWHHDVPHSIKGYAIFGFGLLILLVAGFGFWGAAAPIAGAVIAKGNFVVTGQNKVVQHLEGGIIQEILVNEGDVVQKGDTLIRLDRTAPLANLRRLELRLSRFEAIEARLNAMIAGSDTIEFSQSLLERASDPDVADIIESQRAAFEVDMGQLKSEIAILQHSIDSLHQRIQGNEAQQVAAETQLEFLDAELSSKRQLLEKNLIRLPEMLAIQRAKANLNGDIGRLVGEVGDINERIARTREEILRAKSINRQKAAVQLQDIEAQIDDVQEQINAAKDVLNRVNIVAPTRGIIGDLHYHTSGGVIESGRDIVEIVPMDSEMLLEVRIRPQDIDTVRVGQEAAIRLTALNQRTTPTMSGWVTFVSPDSQPTDEVGQAGDVYLARVKLDRTHLEGLREELADFTPLPGMPAEVHIKTKERTFFDYLTRPLRDSMSRAFKEN
ncbi:HlyD family type I secretion periplasmic adaptor subunit [Pseudovibrio exalbescens]|uniref:HlyD family type I secretion periplasmic adaptor subunit n=1 Tax=Pseudovibrio exalbescens TaxID=197461 RepID=UPI00041E1DEB|nr:HlyD family type I secretion periplasmic adaptor subunit [Pseudovibrio exalbescens]